MQKVKQSSAFLAYLIQYRKTYGFYKTAGVIQSAYDKGLLSYPNAQTMMKLLRESFDRQHGETKEWLVLR